MHQRCISRKGCGRCIKRIAHLVKSFVFSMSRSDRRSSMNSLKETCPFIAPFRVSTGFFGMGSIVIISPSTIHCSIDDSSRLKRFLISEGTTVCPLLVNFVLIQFRLMNCFTEFYLQISYLSNIIIFVLSFFIIHLQQASKFSLKCQVGKNL